MSDLAGGRCEPCRKGAPQVTSAEADELLREVPEWSIRNVDGEDRLERVFAFPDFAAAMAFSVRIGEIAEQEGHHPALLTEWGRVTVGWWTHKIGGLHRNDFVMAAKTDEVYREAEAAQASKS
ncbi:MAG TPA: 4a-hydroxytetrahydrobiopterin dehydratase [Longimicrobium sp.]|nr:4a-hydroxytetrahydrobiopterin dehydratase [Longimicrobium sp.]